MKTFLGISPISFREIPQNLAERYRNILLYLELDCQELHQINFHAEAKKHKIAKSEEPNSVTPMLFSALKVSSGQNTKTVKIWEDFT